MWVLPGMYVGILLDLYWLKVRKWKIWKLFGIAFISIAFYGMLMYFTLDMPVNIEQYRLAIFLRGFAYAILAPALMWALDESVPSLEQFFMGLFVFNILHIREFDISTSLLNMSMSQPEHVLQHKEARKYR